MKLSQGRYLLAAFLSLLSITNLQAQPQGNRARLVIQVPPGARLFIEGTPAKQTAEVVRLFDSPPLDPNETYSYTLKATWMDSGKEVTNEKTVSVRAGQTVKVDLRPETPPTVKKEPPPAEPKPVVKAPTPPEKKDPPPVIQKQPVAEPKQTPPPPPVVQKPVMPEKKEPVPTPPPVVQKPVEPEKKEPATPPVVQKPVMPEKKELVAPPIPPVVQKKPDPVLKLESISDVKVMAGKEATLLVPLKATGIEEPIRVELGELPPEVVAEPGMVKPDAVGKDGGVKLLLKVSETASAGTHKVAALAATGSVRATGSFMLTILPMPKPAAIALQVPATLEALPGTGAKLPVKVARTEYVGPVIVQLRGVPGVARDLEVSIPDGKDSTEFELALPKEAKAGQHAMKLIARGGKLEAQGNVDLMVKAPPVPPLSVFVPGTLTLQISGFGIALPVKVQRGNAQAPVTVRFEDVPGNVTLKELTVPPGQEVAYVETAVAGDAEPGEKEVKLIATCGEARVEQPFKVKITKR